MKHINQFFKAVTYSCRLIYESSQFMILLYFLLDVLTATLPLFSAFALKNLLDILSTKSFDMESIILSVVLYIFALVVLPSLNSIKEIVYNSIFKKSILNYDCNILEKLAKLPMSFIDTSEGRDIIDDVRYTQNNAVNLIFRIVQILSSLYTFCIAFGTLIAFNVWFSFLFLILSVPGIIMDIILEHKTEELRYKTAPDIRKFCYYRWMLTDAWPAKDVRMYDLTEPIKSRYNIEKDNYMKANVNLHKKKLFASLLAELVMRSGEIVFLVFVVSRALVGEVSVGDVSLYIGFAITTTAAFQNVARIFLTEYIETTEMLGRVFDFMETKYLEDVKENRKLLRFESLVFDNVFFKYPHTDKYVLTGVSFTLNKGDKIAIVGINGSGKSTIIKLMLGLYEIQSGQILINGYPMADYDIRDVRKLFSVLFQSFVQYPLTLRENIALSSLERIENSKEIESALMQSGVLEDLEPKLENGLDSFMTRQFADKGTELSKGQWQKIALSRTYFKNAPIIIFDEPSAALDAEAENQIFNNFKSISKGKTGIMISHRISSARMSNKIIVLDNGKITETGTHDDLMMFGGLYANMYDLQREKYSISEV